MERKSTHTFSAFIKQSTMLLLLLMNYQLSQANSCEVVNASLNHKSGIVSSSKSITNVVSVQAIEGKSFKTNSTNNQLVVNSNLYSQAHENLMLGTGNFKLSNQITYYN